MPSVSVTAAGFFLLRTFSIWFSNDQLQTEYSDIVQAEFPRKILVAISLSGIVGILWLGFVSGDLQKANVIELILGGFFLCFPSLLLASLGYRKTASVALTRILLVSSLLSSSLWLLTALFFATADAVDAQSGLLVAFVFLLQWGIAVIGGISFWWLQKV